jgi:hypothetical protein
MTDPDFYTIHARVMSQTNSVIEKIRSFGFLEEGWDFGEGSPAPQEVIETAINLHKMGSTLGINSNAFPGADGEISVAFYFGTDTIEVKVNRDLSFNLTHERGIGADYDILEYLQDVSQKEIESSLIHLKGEGTAWKSSERYTPRNMTPTANDLRAIRLPIFMEVYPSLIFNVFQKCNTVSATI